MSINQNTQGDELADTEPTGLAVPMLLSFFFGAAAFGVAAVAAMHISALRFALVLITVWVSKFITKKVTPADHKNMRTALAWVSRLPLWRRLVMETAGIGCFVAIGLLSHSLLVLNLSFAAYMAEIYAHAKARKLGLV